MRSIALYLCAFALIACSSEGTGQSTSAVAGGDPPSQSGSGNSNANINGNGKGKGKGGGGGSADASSMLSGCTYTQGYWKNHPSAWPVTSLTIGGVSYSEQQLLDLFNTPPMGDASLILAHQLIAALLNVANGAAPSAAVQQAINDAQAWMAANRGDAGLPYAVSAGSAAGQQATALTQTLDNFNSGQAGTPHCGSGGGSSSGGGSGGSSGSGSSGGGPSCDVGVTACPNGAESPCPTGTQCMGGCCLTPPAPPPGFDAGPTI
jgi:hypothetical protein